MNDNSTVWEAEYLKERSNSTNGVLVEMRIYGENDRTGWLLNRIGTSLAELQRVSGKDTWIITSPSVSEEVDRMLRELSYEELNIDGEGTESDYKD